MKTRQKSILIASVSLLGLGWACGASAQEAQVEELVVTGIRASLQQSLETKRAADAIVDSVTAEDVGKFPNTNVAEALTMVPGVTVDRQFGQGEKVSILGTDPALNRTLLNGQTVAFHRPHKPKTARAYQIAIAREFLEGNGVKP